MNLYDRAGTQDFSADGRDSEKHGTNITEVYITRIFVKTWSCSLSGAFWTFSFTWL